MSIPIMQTLMSAHSENQILQSMKNYIIVAAIANVVTQRVIMSANASVYIEEMVKVRMDAGRYFQDMQLL